MMIERGVPSGMPHITGSSRLHQPQQHQPRKQLGLTQAELALAAGVGVRFLVELENGKPSLRLALVLRVIDALGGKLDLSGLPGE
jgi:y4mF family transcriptional regulator